MNRVALSFCFALLSAIVAVAPGGLVEAHTRTTRVVTVQPSAKELLQRMQQAVQRAGTVHFAGTFLISVDRLSQSSLQMTGDQSARPRLAHVYVTTRTANAAAGTGSTVTSAEIVVVGRRSAERLNQRRWRCTATSSVLDLVQSFARTLRINTAEYLGSTTVMGTPVWVVRARARFNTGFQTVTMPATYYISQRDNTLVQTRVTVTLHISGSVLREHIAIAYSRYGAPVHIQLPPGCGA